MEIRAKIWKANDSFINLKFSIPINYLKKVIENGTIQQSNGDKGNQGSYAFIINGDKPTENKD